MAAKLRAKQDRHKLLAPADPPPYWQPRLPPYLLRCISSLTLHRTTSCSKKKGKMQMVVEKAERREKQGSSFEAEEARTAAE